MAHWFEGTFCGHCLVLFIIHHTVKLIVFESSLNLPQISEVPWGSPVLFVHRPWLTCLLSQRTIVYTLIRQTKVIYSQVPGETNQDEPSTWMYIVHNPCLLTCSSRNVPNFPQSLSLYLPHGRSLFSPRLQDIVQCSSSYVAMKSLRVASFERVCYVSLEHQENQDNGWFHHLKLLVVISETYLNSPTTIYWMGLGHLTFLRL